MNLARGFANLLVVWRALPSPSSRAIMREAWRIERALPQWFASQPLPDLMRRLDDEANAQHINVDAATITRLVDAAVMLDHLSPLGICLRRSLVRYVMLRRANVPVSVRFGAKQNTTNGQHKIAGHAWLTLDGQPYAEKPEDYHDFAPIYTYPENPKFRVSVPNPNLELPTPSIDSPRALGGGGRTASNL
ncbi:MAG: lasso peptide biosynthesis B2 protein [Chloroflexota bacterium]